MNTVEELKKIKAKNLMYKKAICRDFNIGGIYEELETITNRCAEATYYIENDDEELICNLIGDEDDAREFKMMFSDLSYDCMRMYDDLENGYVPECFDDFFVKVSENSQSDMLGWDSYECDYFGLDSFEGSLAAQEAEKRLMRLSKKEILEAAHQCFKTAMAYFGLKDRYNNLSAAYDILKERNKGLLETIKRINSLYEKAEADNFYQWKESTQEFEKLIATLPPEVWLN